MILIDSHCHLVSHGLERQPKDLEIILKNNERMDVKYMLAASACLTDIQPNVSLANSNDNIFCSIGLHPSEANSSFKLEQLSCYADNPKVVAIGEIGLDYYYCTSDKGDPTVTDQKRLLNEMLVLGKNSSLPFIFHARECFPDILDILTEHQINNGVFHCYTDNVENAKKVLDKGFYISFSGIITFKKSDELRTVLRYIPDDRLLIETDSPYLAPVPLRGQTNEPSYVRLVAERIAEEMGKGLEQIAEITTSNFFNLFERARKFLEITKKGENL